jgi:putative ABC transport system ATP-binding protein
MTSIPASVAINDVTHSYPRADSAVLNRVSAQFVRGQVTAIYGPSGSGKSTLLSILGLLMQPDSGTITIFGELAWRSRSQSEGLRRSAFSWVLQNSACLEARLAVDNVAMVRLSQGVSFDQAHTEARHALEQVGLGHRLSARASKLSGGELQRVTIARAISSRKPVVLADEPTGQLDRHNTGLVARALRACADAGRVVIVATHDSNLIRYCDRRLEIVDGQVSGPA